MTIGGLLLLGGIGGSVWWLQAEPVARPISTGAATSSAQFLQAPNIPSAIATPTATPNIITVSTPTQVVFTVSIPEPTLNPASVNLLRVNPSGTSTIAAAMLDNGQNGDQQPGDKIFTARLSLNEPQAGEVKFQASAAFRGILKRVTSAPGIVHVWNHFFDAQSGVDLRLPALTLPTRISIHELTSERFFEIEILDPRDNNYKSVFSVLLYQNPNSEPLPLWFQSTIDKAGTLLNTIYVQRTFASGITSLARSAPLPDTYLQSDGPIEEIFAAKPGSSIVIGIIQSQDVKLSEFGYSQNAVQQLFQTLVENLSQ